jgi:hypothetical protein
MAFTSLPNKPKESPKVRYVFILKRSETKGKEQMERRRKGKVEEQKGKEMCELFTDVVNTDQTDWQARFI